MAEFGMDVLLRCHHKAYAYMNVHTKYIHFIIILCDTGGKFWSTPKCIFLLSEGSY